MKPSPTERSRSLVSLLKGEGLNGSTLEALLRPESLAALKTVLNDQLFPEEVDDRVVDQDALPVG